MFEKCGKCEHWMKRPDCPRESKGLKPSCADWACAELRRKNGQ